MLEGRRGREEEVGAGETFIKQSSVNIRPCGRWLSGVHVLTELYMAENYSISCLYAGSKLQDHQWMSETMDSTGAGYLVVVVVVVFFSFLLTWHKLELLGGRTLNWKDACVRLAYGQVCHAFAWSVMDVRRPSPLWVVPPVGCGSGVYKKKTSRANQEDQASNQHSSVASSSVPASRLLPWVLALTFLDDGRTIGCKVKYSLTSLNCFWS